MQDPATLSRDRLLNLFKRQEVVLGQKDSKLKTNDDQLKARDDQLAAKDDIIKQLEQKNKDCELAYNKLWHDDFTGSRHRDGPELFFADYSGSLLGDCWHGLESIALASSGKIVRAACNSHARRKIRDSTIT